MEYDVSRHSALYRRHLARPELDDTDDLEVRREHGDKREKEPQNRNKKLIGDTTRSVIPNWHTHDISACFKANCTPGDDEGRGHNKTQPEGVGAHSESPHSGDSLVNVGTLNHLVTVERDHAEYVVGGCGEKDIDKACDLTHGVPQHPLPPVTHTHQHEGQHQDGVGEIGDGQEEDERVARFGLSELPRSPQSGDDESIPCDSGKEKTPHNYTCYNAECYREQHNFRAWFCS